MRKAFVSTLMEIARKDSRVVLLTADLGFAFLEPFARELPHQFINMGVAEQNMIGVANGLAKEGYLPFAYSITTFAVLRTFEFIRNGPAAHNFPVRVVGVGSGVDYAQDGLTHHALEDLGLMRLLPTFDIITPCDGAQASAALTETYDRPHPIYYRLSKNDAVSVPEQKGRFTFGEIDLLKPGKDCIIFTTGTVGADALAAAKKLQQLGVNAAVASFSTMQPFPRKQLQYLLSGYSYAFCYETHHTTGGLGSAIAEAMVTTDSNCQLFSHGLEYTPLSPLGSATYIHAQHKLDVESMVKEVMSVCSA